MPVGGGGGNIGSDMFEGMEFHMSSISLRKILQPIIEAHGGVVSRNPTPRSTKLFAAQAELEKLTEEARCLGPFYKADYIDACVRAGEKLPTSDFKFVDAHVVKAPSTRSITGSRRRGRMPNYTDTDDERLCDKVDEWAREGVTAYMGNNLWKQLERENYMPGRTWQSLRNRYKNVIRPLRELRKQRADGERAKAVAFRSHRKKPTRALSSASGGVKDDEEVVRGKVVNKKRRVAARDDSDDDERRRARKRKKLQLRRISDSSPPPPPSPPPLPTFVLRPLTPTQSPSPSPGSLQPAADRVRFRSQSLSRSLSPDRSSALRDNSHSTSVKREKRAEKSRKRRRRDSDDEEASRSPPSAVNKKSKAKKRRREHTTEASRDSSSPPRSVKRERRSKKKRDQHSPRKQKKKQTKKKTTKKRSGSDNGDGDGDERRGIPPFEPATPDVSRVRSVALSKPRRNVISLVDSDDSGGSTTARRKEAQASTKDPRSGAGSSGSPRRQRSSARGAGSPRRQKGPARGAGSPTCRKKQQVPVERVRVADRFSVASDLGPESDLAPSANGTTPRKSGRKGRSATDPSKGKSHGASKRPKRRQRGSNSDSQPESESESSSAPPSPLRLAGASPSHRKSSPLLQANGGVASPSISKKCTSGSPKTHEGSSRSGKSSKQSSVAQKSVAFDLAPNSDDDDDADGSASPKLASPKLASPSRASPKLASPHGSSPSRSSPKLASRSGSSPSRLSAKGNAAQDENSDDEDHLQKSFGKSHDQIQRKRRSSPSAGKGDPNSRVGGESRQKDTDSMRNLSEKDTDSPRGSGEKDTDTPRESQEEGTDSPRGSQEEDTDTPIEPTGAVSNVCLCDERNTSDARARGARCCNKPFHIHDAKRALYGLQHHFQLPDEVVGAMLYSMNNRVEDTVKLLEAMNSESALSTEQWCRAQGIPFPWTPSDDAILHASQKLSKSNPNPTPAWSKKFKDLIRRRGKGAVAYRLDFLGGKDG